MAIIFMTDGIGRAITRCWLNGNEVSRLAVRANIPAVESRLDLPPAIGYLKCSGSIDLLDTDDEGSIIADVGEVSPSTRRYGMIKLIWGASMPGGGNV